VWAPRRHPEAHQGLDVTSKTLGAIEAVPPKRLLTEGWTAGSEGKLTVVAGAGAGGCSKPLVNVAGALVVLS